MNNVQWKTFNVKDIFNFIDRGKRLIASKRQQGNYPFITAGKFNNGVASFIENPEHEVYHNAITIDMFGKTFYHSYSFKCDDNITILKNNKFSKDIYLFLVVSLDALSKKYAYGLQLRPNRLNNDKIMLPVDNKGEPNWQFMEDYIRISQEKQKNLILKYYKDNKDI